MTQSIRSASVSPQRKQGCGVLRLLALRALSLVLDQGAGFAKVERVESLGK